MSRIAVQCKNLKKSYGQGENKIMALKDVNLDIYKGQLTLLVGPSGSGKSTLLSIIATILTSDHGQLFLLDHEVSKMTEAEKSVFRRDYLGIVFQSFFLIPTLTVAENVALPLIVAGQEESVALDKANVLLKAMHIEKRANAVPTELSKGQQQRVAIARAMINDSQVILCDEPTSSLDQATGTEVMTLLRALTEHSSRAVLVITHDLRLFPFADRIIKMNDGQIISVSDEHE
ncbi:MAG: ABC transporter ATP-binding protein [Parachlamydiaceae bacterium]